MYTAEADEADFGFPVILLLWSTPQFRSKIDKYQPRYTSPVEVKAISARVGV